MVKLASNLVSITSSELEMMNLSGSSFGNLFKQIVKTFVPETPIFSTFCSQGVEILARPNRQTPQASRWTAWTRLAYSEYLVCLLQGFAPSAPLNSTDLPDVLYQFLFIFPHPLHFVRVGLLQLLPITA